jgi:N6-L-threonylcarbamoyladenine synthase
VDRFRWILGIESSCDETAVAVLEDGQRLAADLVASQIELHQVYGGVVPEVASRQHMETVSLLTEQALAAAGIRPADLDGVAVAKGPGLVGALLVGLNFAKGLAYRLNLPFLGVNHMEGHIYANWLSGEDIPFPLLGLIVSGGHTALLLLEQHGRYRLLGQTRDDAAGEAYDKVARAMGLGYPGGPLLDQLAAAGDAGVCSLPRPRLRDDPWGFSFSGLKTAVSRQLEQAAARGETIRTADLAAAFQKAVVDYLTEKTLAAAAAHGVERILLAGGVAANQGLRARMAAACADSGLRLYLPAPRYCTDNAAMIACAGYHRLRAGQRDGWDLNADPSLALCDI